MTVYEVGGIFMEVQLPFAPSQILMSFPFKAVSFHDILVRPTRRDLNANDTLRKPSPLRMQTLHWYACGASGKCLVP